jgi:hypothetical protein
VRSIGSRADDRQFGPPLTLGQTRSFDDPRAMSDLIRALALFSRRPPERAESGVFAGGWPVEVQFFRPCRTCRTIWSFRNLPQLASAASRSIILVICFAKRKSRSAKITSSTYALL